ncbi:MAG: PH domain-containing protein [Candidatus Methanomethyliaceae archaeon]|nr:PH domain-containing protein [Candidatus Methanomethyliaceae archaeon]
MKIGETFQPDPKMKALYFTYLALILAPLFVLGFGIFLYLLLISERTVATIFAIFYILPLIVITIFVSYWIPKYYNSIKYLLTENEVRVERGVWWKMRHAVPFSRIMSVDTVQGPLSRHFGIGTVDIYTAGYTGRAGGGSGPSVRRAEASIMFVPDFLELREEILNIVKGRPLFGVPGVHSDVLGQQMLEELKEIRKLLSSKPAY